MYKIFPITLTHDKRKVPVKDFKWKEQCSSDPEVIASWSTLYPQMKFFGLPCGPENGILVLDVDVKSGGLETIKNYHVPLTQTQRTLSGGIHYVFKYPNDGKVYGNRVGFDAGLDIRGAKGYIAVYGLDSTPLAECPEWLKEQALSVEKAVVDFDNLVKVSPEVARNILAEACQNVLDAPAGESNNILNVEAYKVGQLLPSNSINHDEAFNALFNAAKEKGKEDYESTATINSGFASGQLSPITEPFGSAAPVLNFPLPEPEEKERWTPKFFTKYDLCNTSNLRKPQIFKDWSTEDISITTADGGTGKTTLKLYEAICLALGESFLGFECLGAGRTLFITGEDTALKLGAMIGAIMRQMGILEDDEKVKKILNNIVVKKDSDLCLISKSKQGFIVLNESALDNVMQAIEDIRPKLIVFDPISSFWGSESALNDMNKAVIKFVGELVEKSNCCVEIINHMGKQSSSNKDMTQFAGRGGTGLPSHARVSRVLRPIFGEEYEELTGMNLSEEQTAMMCNVNKFSDGSPLFNKPFLIIREGYLFSKLELVEQKVKEEQNKMSDVERVFTFVKNERTEGRYPTKDIITATFMAANEKIGKDRVNRALSVLGYTGHLGERIKHVEDPDVESTGKVYIVTDLAGKES